jgi:peroxin-2
MRVGQLDSELLDQELVQLLQEPLNKTLALVNVCEQLHLQLHLLMIHTVFI